jgi:predicted nuclease with TOPRIM domain
MNTALQKLYERKKNIQQEKEILIEHNKQLAMKTSNNNGKLNEFEQELADIEQAILVFESYSNLIKNVAVTR